MKELEKFGKLVNANILRNKVEIIVKVDENDGDYITETELISLSYFKELLKEYFSLVILDEDYISEDRSHENVMLKEDKIEDYIDSKLPYVEYAEKTLLACVFSDFIPRSNDDAYVHSIEIKFKVYDEKGMCYKYNLINEQ